MKKSILVIFIMTIIFTFIYSVTIPDGLMKQAKNGNANAQFQVGIRYYYQPPGKANISEAFKWIKKSADQNNPKAIFVLGKMYETGFRGTKSVDRKKAFNLYKKSSELGCTEAQCEIALKYEEGFEGVVSKNMNEALKWYRKAGNNGNMEAQYLLGMSYYEGNLTPRNPSKSKIWLEKAANQGHAESQYYLVNLYYYGEGCSKSISKAKYWLKKSYNNAEDDVTLQDMVIGFWQSESLGPMEF